MDNLNKKQKFIILTILGGILILATFIWSMIINISQFSLSENVPSINTPKLEDNKSDDKKNTEIKDVEKEKNQELDLDKILKQ